MFNAQLMSKPDKAEKICLSLSEKIKKEFKSIDLILSPAMGGIIVDMRLADCLKRNNFF